MMSTGKRKNQKQELINCLTTLLKYNWDINPHCKVDAFFHNLNNNITKEKNIFKVLTTIIFKANAKSLAQFAFITQYNIKELKSYDRRMQCPHAPQQAQTMKEELDFLYKSKTQILISKDENKLGH